MTEVWDYQFHVHEQVRDLLERYSAGERQFGGISLHGGDLRGAVLNSARFYGASLSDADFTDADLNQVDLVGANLVGARMRRASLNKADLGSASLIGADLSDARVTGAFLGGANLSDANLSNADLSGADLGRANLAGANVSGANLAGAICSHTLFSRVNLHEAKNVGAMLHCGPSSIGVDALHESGGRLPLTFMRGCGVPESLIAFSRSFAPASSDSHTCFISHSSSDREFVERLYADLQNRGVRCWYAPEDLGIGQNIRGTIRHSIKEHERLLIVLSEHSINSSWVESEVEAAFQEESHRNDTVLVPITVDPFAMTCEVPWVEEIRLTRHIGDFSNWREPANYRRTFEKLTHSLKKENTPRRGTFPLQAGPTGTRR
jgi:hypothetical protein